MQLIEYSPWDLDYDDPNDEPICRCPEYIGTTHVVFCKACHAWTDDIELFAMDAAEKKPAAIAVSAHTMAEVA